MKKIWCEQHLVKNRSLIILAAISVLVIVGLVISLALVISFKDKEIGKAVCLTSGCVKTASTVIRNINPKIKPCNNFYEFACGGYVASAPVPFGELAVSPFTELMEDIQDQLKSIIEEPGGPDEPRHFQLARTLYKTCMNTTALEETGLDPLRKILNEFGNWPVVAGSNWTEDDFDWAKSVYKAAELGYPVHQFITLELNVDWVNSSKYVLSLDRASFGLTRDTLIKGLDSNATVKPYFDYMVDIAAMLGADKDQAAKELRDSLEFEMKLANISLSDEKRQNLTLLNNRMTIAELENRYPSVNWVEYINNLLPAKVRVYAEEVVMVMEPNFISDLEELLANTPKRVQANYMLWRIVADSLIYLTENVRQRETVYMYRMGLYGAARSLLRWKQCVAILSSSSLAPSINALYVRRYFKDEAKQNVVKMVAEIRNEAVKVLENAKWMDETTRNRAVQKATSMLSLVGHPVELLDDKLLEDYYTHLELDNGDFLGNVLSMNLFANDALLELLRKPVVRNTWITHHHSTKANAFYDPSENSIQIPAGLLQGIFFSSDRPRYMNYGSIGFLIGHEVTHSFDLKRRQFDKDGNMADWWRPETTEKYLDKVQCMIDQYSNYTVQSAGRNVDGTHTINENWADNGGVKKAYLAYKEYVKRNGPEAKLPGLDYTPEQMFWISAANTWCAKFVPEAVQYELSTDVHSPNRFRVIGSLSNSPEFAADFNCPLGSYMNPVHKCSVL